MSIDLQNVEFTYPKAKKSVLNIKNWSVSVGEQVFVHGASGAGKSTLLNLLSGILVSEKGSVSVLDKQFNQMSPSQRDRFRANHIGYVFQQFNLIPYLSAIDNIELAGHFANKASTVNRNEVEHLLNTLNISSVHWKKPSDRLSIGQQQRVAIARALINKPQILIADEPTSALDQDNRDNFMSVIMSFVAEQNISLVFVSHDMSMAQYFNRVDALSDFNRVNEA